MSSSRNTVSISLATSDMVITVDTRERSPWRFQNTNTPVIFSTLKTGDYSVRGLEDVVVIERKEHGDFLTSCGKNRRRFMAEMERMKSIPHRLLIVETDYTNIALGLHPRSRIDPDSVTGTMVKLASHGIQVMCLGERKLAESFAYRFLTRIYLMIRGVKV